jgi:hypothetical protein
MIDLQFLPPDRHSNIEYLFLNCPLLVVNFQASFWVRLSRPLL